MTSPALVEAVAPPEGAQVQVTVVLPCYNEVGHVEAEIIRITKAMDASGYIYDLDVYDDMSSDGTRDDMPIPRWSSRITRAKDASLRWKRYIDGSASTVSIGMDGPGSTSRSVGPSPKAW